MAEKKRTTAAKSKKAAPKKVAAKTTTKAKATKASASAKKTAKKTTTKRATTTKKATTRKPAVKKTAAKKPAVKKTTTKTAAKSKAKKIVPTKTAASQSALSYMDWENVVKGALQAFPKLWWRVGLVNVTSLLLIFASVILSGAVFILSVGGFAALENVLANIQFGGGIDMSSKVALAISIFIFFNLMIVVSVLGKVSNFLVVKNYISGENRNPLAIYFKDSWAFFWRYLWLGLIVFWYIMWPTLLFGLIALIIGVLTDVGMLVEVVSIPVLVIGGIGIGIMTIYRSFNALFYQGVLIESDDTSRNCFHKTLSLVKGNWWRVFVAAVVFFLLVSAIQMLLNVPGIMADMGTLPEAASILSTLLDFIFSFFILAPISVSFMYFLMLQIAKNKKITL